MNAINTDQLSKHYGDVLAVQDLSLQVAEGEIYAFLGLNGAGKTTTIRMLLGMIKATTGWAKVLGTPVHMGSREPWAQVGYLVETTHAYPELTVRENLEVARRMHTGVPSRAVAEVIEQLGLAEYAGRRAGKLSLGNKQRLGLAKTLLHRPRLLILDEPANGLDPAGIVEVRQLLRSLAQDEGVTVFMSSHILGEVARLAHRIGIIHQGKLLQEMDVAQLEKNRRKWLTLATRDNPATLPILNAAGYAAEMNHNGQIYVSGDRAIQQPEEVAALLVHKGVPPVRLAADEEDLEDYFLRLTGTKQDVHNELLV